MSLVSSQDADRRAIFFRIAFGEEAEGYVCIARRERGSKVFIEEFFHWPDQAAQINDYVERFIHASDIWFCPQLLSRKKRTKDAVILCPSAWADLDSCPPEKLLVAPNILVESSPNRYQCLWRFEQAIAPLDAEDISRRVAYAHAEDGCDKSGWDLTQLLRVPYTYNQKYAGDGEPPVVTIIKTRKDPCHMADFEPYPQLAEYKAFVEAEMPKELEDSSDIMMRHRSHLHPMAFILFSQEPKSDWSKALWSLELLCFESGLSLDETFAIIQDAACNKYERDNRGIESLWKEVVRAYEHHEKQNYEAVGISRHFDGADPLLSDEQRERVTNDRTFIEDYIEWAKSLGDASWQYHQAGAFIVLSSVLSGNVRIPTSFGTVTPNLWFMILADTTLTRKTTSMDIAMSLLDEVDDNAILATDGSIEGLFQSLANRPGRPSIFLRDEFSGLLDAMNRKDYMAGMGESLTKLYDGKYQKRILKRESIEVRDPVLLLFAGGIRSRIFELLSFDNVVSGFLPRFVFITADADVTRLKPVGPPTKQSTTERDRLAKVLRSYFDRYTQAQQIKVGDKTTIAQRRFEAQFSAEAWLLYNQFESQLITQGMNHTQRDVMMPSLDRLAKSGMKCAALFGAMRCMDKDEITVSEIDVLHAFWYVEQWREHLLIVLENIGKTPYEKLADLIVSAVDREPGIARGTVMRMYHLSSKQAEDILRTLEERALIRRVKSGRAERLYLPGQKETSVSNGSGTESEPESGSEPVQSGPIHVNFKPS